MPADESSRAPSIDDLTRKNAGLRQELEKTQVELAAAHGQLATAQTELERLRKELEEALRALQRQAAPFSRRHRKPTPNPPGRKPGDRYGQRASRPGPARVDEEIPVPLPPRCSCGGRPLYRETQPQFQEDILRQTIVRRFDVEVGQCASCGRRLQGRHPLQTSEALGAAQVQVGAEALTLATVLNKEMGLSHERAARVLAVGFGLPVSRSGLCRGILRLGRKAEPTYQQLRIVVHHSWVAWMDETGWRVGARFRNDTTLTR